jgi:hypothetical protein
VIVRNHYPKNLLQRSWSTIRLSASQEDGTFEWLALPAARKWERESEQLQKQMTDLYTQQRTDQEQQATQIEWHIVLQREES